MNDWLHQLTWNAIAYAAVGGIGIVALAAMIYFVPKLRKSWFPLQRLRPGNWTGYDVFLAFCIFIGSQRLVVDTLLWLGFFTPLIGPPPDREAAAPAQLVYALRCLAIASPLSLAFVLGCLLPVLYARSNARPPHYGLSWSRFAPNVALGVVAFLLIRPAVIGIYALAVLLFPLRTDPFDEFAKQDLADWEWLLFAFYTCVGPPILEEILCRGLLQGWLRRATLIGHVTFLFMTLFVTLMFGSLDLSHYDGIGPLMFAGVLAGGYAFWLFWLTRRFQLNDEEMQGWRPMPMVASLEPSWALSEEETRALRQAARDDDDRRVLDWKNANARLAIFGSSMFFAALHTNWPASLALFPMGLALGWLYHRTQSLVGPIVFHALFNVTTFIALYGTAMDP